jgi:hypothetical protein
MTPGTPFVAIFYCERCRSDTEHFVYFMSLSTETWKVNYFAVCSDCYHDVGEGETAEVGFASTMSVADWLQIAPEETLKDLN